MRSQSTKVIINIFDQILYNMKYERNNISLYYPFYFKYIRWLRSYKAMVYKVYNKLMPFSTWKKICLAKKTTGKL